ncbi:MAG: ferritin-like domain-containing protein [Phycisphaerales bacterium]|nr:ferritin-like domain-containing protein [Phycisphaerales bacterium]
MTMRLDHLEKLFVEQLKDAYSAESQLIEALPKIRDAANAKPLAEAFDAHLAETKGHRDRIERIFKTLDYKPGGHRCKAMAGLVEEAMELVADDATPAVRDAALICAAQKIEHYEIATYGCLRSYAALLHADDAVALIDETLDEERHADAHLTELAEQWVNVFAMKTA